jgi:hypothetical protein
MRRNLITFIAALFRFRSFAAAGQDMGSTGRRAKKEKQKDDEDSAKKSTTTTMMTTISRG